MRLSLILCLLTFTAMAGCFGGEDDTTGDGGPTTLAATFNQYTLPAVYQDPIGLYEPTIDVADDGAIYVSAHSTEVGRNPAPAYYSLDDGATWRSMALLMDQQAEPEEQGSAPLLSDEVFIVAADGGTAWGLDCCVNAHAPLVGWCDNGATACYYNQNAYLSEAHVTGAAQCGATPLTTDRPWLAYADGKLLLVNNPGGGPLQVGAMDVPPPAPFAYTGTAWQIEWNLCGSSGGYIPGIPDMRNDHFFAVPQWQDYGGSPCDPDATSHYDVITGHADDMSALTQTTVFENTHVPPAEADSTPSQIGQYGQAVFDADGMLYVGAMNNSATEGEDGACIADPQEGGLHFALSTDDGATYTETTFRFDRPVSAFYMDGNRYGEGFLVNWGEIDGNHTDWFLAHVFPDENGTLRLENVMLAVDDGPEASRHVQGAALGPDGRAYMVFSYNSQNPGASDQASPGDTPLRVAVQQDGPVMPTGAT